MKSILVTLGVIAGLALVVGMWFMGSYNAMVAGDERVQTAWSNVETQYQRRFDLIPNLVGSVQGILTQEQEIFSEIAQARTQYAGSKNGTREEQVEAYGQYESVVGRLLVVMENYPQLRSYENVRALTDELAGTENRVLVSRDRYNAEVQTWNVSIKRFPRNILAGMFGFETKVRFESEEGSEKAPKVQLNQNVNTEK